VIAPSVEARMAQFAAETELEARRKRAQSVLDEHAAWQNQQEAAAAELESQRSLDRVRLQVAKLKF
jgi:hypothetical protein